VNLPPFRPDESIYRRRKLVWRVGIVDLGHRWCYGESLAPPIRRFGSSGRGWPQRLRRDAAVAGRMIARRAKRSPDRLRGSAGADSNLGCRDHPDGVRASGWGYRRVNGAPRRQRKRLRTGAEPQSFKGSVTRRSKAHDRGAFGAPIASAENKRAQLALRP
jgi:hypothetical protein